MNSPVIAGPIHNRQSNVWPTFRAHLWQVIAACALVVYIQRPIVPLERPCPLGEALVLPPLLSAKDVRAHVLGVVLLVVLGGDSVQVHTRRALGAAAAEEDGVIKKLVIITRYPKLLLLSYTVTR